MFLPTLDPKTFLSDNADQLHSDLDSSLHHSSLIPQGMPPPAIPYQEDDLLQY